MSRISNINNSAREEYIVSVLSRETGLEGKVTPDLAVFDFLLFDDRDYRIIGEIKTRTDFYQEWFVADHKIDWLMKANETFRCTPWFVIYCLEDKMIYRLNLYDNYEYESVTRTNRYSTGNQTDKGRDIPLKYWERIDPNSSPNGGISSIQIK
jgi:hypothetical protein